MKQMDPVKKILKEDIDFKQYEFSNTAPLPVKRDGGRLIFTHYYKHKKTGNIIQFDD